MVVVDIWITPRLKTTRQHQIFPRDEAIQDRTKPARLKRIFVRDALEVGINASCFLTKVYGPLPTAWTFDVESYFHYDFTIEELVVSEQIIHVIPKRWPEVDLRNGIPGLYSRYLVSATIRVCLQVSDAIRVGEVSPL